MAAMMRSASSPRTTGRTPISSLCSVGIMTSMPPTGSFNV